MVSEGPGAVYEEPTVCEPIFKGNGSVLKGLTGFTGFTGFTGLPVTGFRGGPNKTGFKETSEGHKPEDLRPVSQGPRLMVSEGPGPGFRVL